MARPPRLQAPGTVHHLIARGNERREVFRDDLDREDYLGRLARYQERFQFRLYAYCLMPNHVHLAVEQGLTNLSTFMHALQSSYAQRFNRRYERVGHLFQGRYKSFLVDCDRYFLALIRYIHANPVKAGMVDEARLYRWSSDHFFRSGASPPWLDLDGALALLGPSRREAMDRYEALMSDIGPTASAYEALVAREGSVKGDEKFALAALKQVSLPRRSLSWTAETVARAVAACEGLSLNELAGPTRIRSVSRARLFAAYLGRERFGIPVSESARLFRREETGLAHGVRSLEDRLRREPELKSHLERLVQTAKLRA
ncbi:MAG TPA: transposase [Thermoanaerobaculia bacterium]|nr:transposase [Thermoanaerobaculia bacterium]